MVLRYLWSTVTSSIVFARATVPQAFGFLRAEGPDDSRYELGQPTFDVPGTYSLQLIRETTHEYAGDAKLSLLWSSSWQTTFEIVDPPPA